MKELLNDPVFFYTLAFVIFLALAYAKGRKPVLSWLDAEIEKIRTELEKAKLMRKAAEQTLQHYQSKREEAFAEAETIIRQAHADAERLRTQAENDIKAMLSRQEKQAVDRIQRLEAEAIATVRNTIISQAVTAAKKSIEAGIDETSSNRLIDQAIDELHKLNAADAKAA